MGAFEFRDDMVLRAMRYSVANTVKMTKLFNLSNDWLLQ